MSALAMRAGQGVLIWIAGLGALAAVPQAALAAPHQAAWISAGDGHSCAIDSGKAYCWGKNYQGDLGDGRTHNSRRPVAVVTTGALAGQTLTQIAAGDDHTCALDAAGAAYCWGDNQDGQLGDGSTGGSSSVPVAVDTSGALAGQTLTQITVGNGDTCALDAAGTAYCWGLNAVGELGDGNTTSSASVPMAVDTSGALAGQTLTQITASEFHTCALDAAGAAYCWGGNSFGELGNGSAAGDSIVPVAVDASGALAGKTLTQIDAAGEYHTCALDSTGAAYCWGYNGYGQLGNGGTTDSGVPVAVDAAGVLAHQTLTQITAGYYHTCALDAAGAAYCWGYNHDGELGDDSTSALGEVPVLTGPQAPTGVAGLARNTKAVVSWTAPASLDGGVLKGYTATAAPGGASCTTTRAITCTITGLSNGASYSITVVAHTTAGDSGASTPVTVVPTATPTGPILAGDHKAKCVDDSDGSSATGTPLVMWDCNGSAAQNWTIETDGRIKINGKCMDVSRSAAANKTPVDLWTCTGGASQLWRAKRGTLVNPVSGKCLDDPKFNATDGIQLEIYTCNGGTNQQWEIP